MGTPAMMQLSASWCAMIAKQRIMRVTDEEAMETVRIGMYCQYFTHDHVPILRPITILLTCGSRAPPTKAFTDPSLQLTILIVLLSLSATNSFLCFTMTASPDG